MITDPSNLGEAGAHVRLKSERTLFDPERLHHSNESRTQMFKLSFAAALAALIMIPFGTVDNAFAATKNKECSIINPCKIALRLRSKTFNTYGLVPEDSGKQVNVQSSTSQTTKNDTNGEPQLGGELPGCNDCGNTQ